MSVDETEDQFTRHILEIIKKDAKWMLIDKKNPSRGIYFNSTWRDGIQRLTQILPNAGYPLTPPIVRSIPRPKNPCFDNQGFLHWVYVPSEKADKVKKSRKDKDKPAWDRYKYHINPLIYLIDELYVKYGADVFYDLEV